MSLLSLASQTGPLLVQEALQAARGLPAQAPTCLATGISHLGC